jgi:hypothetical protein
MFGNDLLETFVDHSYDLKGRLTPVDFIQGDVLATPGSAIDTLVFPSAGAVHWVGALFLAQRTILTKRYASFPADAGPWQSPMQPN